VEDLPLLRSGSSLFPISHQVPSAYPRVPPAAMEQILSDLIQGVAGSPEIREFRDVRYVLRPGEAIEHHCFARLLPGTLDLKLEGFRQYWQAIKLTAAENAPTASQLAQTRERSFVFQVLLPGNLWGRFLGKVSSLEIAVRLPRGNAETAALTEIVIGIRPVGCSPKKAVEVLRDVAPLLLESVRNYLQPHPERRRQERLTFEQSVRLLPVYEDQQPSEAIVSQAEDLSTGGMKLFLPCRPPTLEITVQLPRPSAGLVNLPARIVRVQPCWDGRFEVGLSFLR